MTINLNNPLVIGTMSADVDKEGKHSFTRWAESSSQEFFLKVAQYLLDGCPDLNESEKAAIREAMGACKLIATVLKTETGEGSIKAEYKRRRAGILAAAGMDGDT